MISDDTPTIAEDTATSTKPAHGLKNIKIKQIGSKYKIFCNGNKVLGNKHFPTKGMAMRYLHAYMEGDIKVMENFQTKPIRVEGEPRINIACSDMAEYDRQLGAGVSIENELKALVELPEEMRPVAKPVNNPTRPKTSQNRYTPH